MITSSRFVFPIISLCTKTVTFGGVREKLLPSRNSYVISIVIHKKGKSNILRGCYKLGHEINNTNESSVISRFIKRCMYKMLEVFTPSLPS